MTGEGAGNADFLVEYEPWMAFANCRGADPNIFILEASKTTADAKPYCDPCPAKLACASYARRTGSVGVWGGILFKLGGEERQILPIRKVLDFRPVPVPESERKRMPAILGKQAANFRRRPSILGKAQ